MKFQWNTRESDEIKLCEKTILKFSLALTRDEEGGNHFSIFCNLFESMMNFGSKSFSYITIRGVDLTISAEILLGFVSHTQE